MKEAIEITTFKLAGHSCAAFIAANADVDAWLKVVMAPLEEQIRAHKSQLKQRTDSIERVHVAIDSLEEKIQSVEMLQNELSAQRNTLMALETDLRNALGSDTHVGTEFSSHRSVANYSVPI